MKSDMNKSDFAKYIQILDIFADPMYPINSLSYEIQEIAMNYLDIQSIIKTPILSDNLIDLLKKQIILFLQKDTRQLTQFYQLNTDNFNTKIFYEFDALFYEQINLMINNQKLKEIVQQQSIKRLEEDEEQQLKDQQNKEQSNGIENQYKESTQTLTKIEEVLNHWNNQVKLHNPEINMNKYYAKLIKQRDPILLQEKVKEKYRQRIKMRDQKRYQKNKFNLTISQKDQGEQDKLIKLSSKWHSHHKTPQDMFENHSFDSESIKQFVKEQEEKQKQYQQLKNSSADSQVERQSQEMQLVKICNNLLGDNTSVELNTKNQDQAATLYKNSLFKQFKSSSSTQNNDNPSSKSFPSHREICRSIGKDFNLNQFILNNLSTTEIVMGKQDKDKTKSGVLPQNTFFNNEIFSNFLRFVFQTLSKEHLEELQLGKYEITVISRILWKMREINMISNRTPRLRYQSYHLMLFFLTITKENTLQVKDHLKLSFLHEKIFGITDYTDQRSLLHANIFKRIMGEITLMQISYLTKQFTEFYGDQFFKPNSIFTDSQSMIYYLMQIQKRIVQYLQGIMCFGI